MDIIILRALGLKPEVLLKPTYEIILWRLNMLLKESVDSENECLYIDLLDEEDKQRD